MQVYTRKLDVEREVEKKSIFLFGPRQTGKTTLLTTLFPNAPFYNLLHSDVFLRLSARPQLLREEIQALEGLDQPVIVDEIQKLPVLLDEIHALIEEQKVRCIVTGSSARKLRRGGYNLLGGRARVRYLFPLVFAEIPHMNIERAMHIGTIPSIYLSDEPQEDLRAYCGTYLQQEVQAEGSVRNIENFSRFLETAALNNADLINYEKFAGDCGVPARTVREYFQVLEDTLIATQLAPFGRTKKRKPVSKGKVYFFDVGVCNALCDRWKISPKSNDYGKTLEHFVFTELCAFLSYSKDTRELTFWRSRTGYEVDFVIGDDTAIEVKAREVITEKQCKGLRALEEDMKLKHKIVISTGKKPAKLGDIHVLPVKDFLEQLWEGAF